MTDLAKLTAYELIMKQDLADIESTGYLLRHKKSGARVMLIENEDDNKVFNIAFRTTPVDSTGVAHIMEHSVLGGSRKFPAKDPFVELAKGSMNTFLNAMTYPDKTMYPVASCNDKDFANLMDVYLDSVFYPNIYQRKQIFLQEGWHYELEQKDAPLTYNGVVYNEMKGEFSVPDSVVDREIMKALFPDTTYHHESGGDPDHIPELSYEQFLDFHRKFYHPSNSYVYLYGKMDFEERLRFLDEAYLSAFDLDPVDSSIGEQAPFEAMQKVSIQYPIGNDEEEKDNTYLTFSAVVGRSLDTVLSSAFGILEHVLLEAPGAPLKQALLDAQIGTDVMGSYDSGIFQPVFSVIAKNANPEDEDRFYEVIRDTLGRIADEGIDEKALRAAINMVEFRFREADFGVFPKGLMYGIDVFDSWLYDDEHPFDYLWQLRDLTFLKEKLGTGYFEDLIRTYLLNNTHAVLLKATPCKGMTTKATEQIEAMLSAYKASLGDEETEELVKQTLALKAYQEEPSTPEELLSIPMLTREDMRREISPVSNEESVFGPVRVIRHDYKTNGIAYIQLLFDAADVPADDLPYLGILKNVLGYVDTEQYAYSDLFQEINLNTGGITFGLSLFPSSADSGKVKLALGVQIKTLYDKIEWSFDTVSEILLTSRLDQKKRILEILHMLSSRTGEKLSASGSATASVRCMSYFSPMGKMNDCFSGIAFYDTLRAEEKIYEEKAGILFARLENVLRKVLESGRLLVSYTGGEEYLDRIGACARDLMHKLDKQRAEVQDGQLLRYYPAMQLEKGNEGLKTAGKVQYVARCGNFADAGHLYTGTLRVLRSILGYDYLWNQIRVMGGAYGCGGSFSRSGESSLVSFRDPHLARTVDVFEKTPDYLENFTADERDMTKYVIGTFSDLDIPLGASARGSRSMNILLSELTEEMLQQERDQILAVSQDDIRAAAPLLRAALDQGYICVLGNEDTIEENKELFMKTRQL